MIESTYILSAARTAIGSFGGSLSRETPSGLGAKLAQEAVSRAALDPASVGHVVYGNVIPTGPEDAYVARMAAIGAQIPKESPAMTVNRLCGSGLQAIISAAQTVMLGDVDVALAGGVEIMSRSPHYVQSARFGQKMGDIKMLDGLSGVLTDPFGNGAMGMTAENVAEKYQISRTEQDAFAAESQRRALVAIEAGHFKSQILPVEVAAGRSSVTFETDEYPKAGTSTDSLATLKPVFKKEGSVTAGNASGINDGAAAVVIASEQYVENAGATPLGRIIAYGHAGVEPGIMGIGPVPAVRKLLQRSGLKITDFDVIESNEAFAAQAIAVNRELGLDIDKVNPDGGAIALGHPIGATGAILAVKALYYLQRTGGRYGLVTMCIGGGQGIAIALERV